MPVNMLPELIIRRLSPDNADTFRSIRLDALASEPDAFATSYSQEEHCSDEEWRRRVKDPVFIAFDAGDPVGTMALLPKHPSRMAHRAELISVYVKERYRATGLASELLRVLTVYAREIGILQLELGVCADNAGAIRFYQREGFEILGCVRHGFRVEGHFFDETRMILRLDRPTG